MTVNLVLHHIYPSVQVLAAAGVEAIASKLHELASHYFGMKTGRQLVDLAQQFTSSGLASSARSTSLKILGD